MQKLPLERTAIHGQPTLMLRRRGLSVSYGSLGHVKLFYMQRPQAGAIVAMTRAETRLRGRLFVPSPLETFATKGRRSRAVVLPRQ